MEGSSQHSTAQRESPNNHKVNLSSKPLGQSITRTPRYTFHSLVSPSISTARKLALNVAFTLMPHASKKQPHICYTNNRSRAPGRSLSFGSYQSQPSLIRDASVESIDRAVDLLGE